MRGRVTPVSLMGNADNHGGKGETGRCELLQANAFTDYRNSANRARASMLADWSPPEADIGVICFRGVATLSGRSITNSSPSAFASLCLFAMLSLL